MKRAEKIHQISAQLVDVVIAVVAHTMMKMTHAQKYHFKCMGIDIKDLKGFKIKGLDDKKEITDDRLFDVVVIEDNTVVLVTYWKQCKYDRALKLAERFEKGINGICGIVLTGSTWPNKKVELVKDREYKAI